MGILGVAVIYFLVQYFIMDTLFSLFNRYRMTNKKLIVFSIVSTLIYILGLYLIRRFLV